MDSDDIKWKSVKTTSREILYYSNKITGQQKWTNKNCYCSKPKDPLQPTLPCCYRTPSMTRKGYTEHSYARRQTRATLSKKLYCLSDIVNEVQKSYLVKEHEKHKRNKYNITLDFKKNIIPTEDPKSNVRITKDSQNNETFEQSKDDVVFIIDSQDLKKDFFAALDLKNDSSFTNEGKKNDVTAKDDSSSDMNVSKDPQPLSKEPKDYVVGIKDIKYDVTAVVNFSDDVTVVKDPKGVIVTADRGNDVCEGKASDSNKPSKTNNQIITEDMEIDVTTIDESSNDVMNSKDVIFTKVTENDDSEAKVSKDAVSNELSTLKEKTIIHKRSWKRKREVSANVNGYKGRLRVRQNKIQRTIRRKYRRRKPLKNVAVPSESVKPNSGDTPKNPSKRKKLEVDNRVLQADYMYDLIEQTIIEINNSLISGGSESTSLSTTTKDRRTSAEKTRYKTSKVPAEVSRLRFIDEKFLRMNIPFQSLAEAYNKESRKSKTTGPKTKHPVSKRKRQRVSPTGMSSGNSSNRVVVTQKSSSSALRSCTSVSSVTLSSTSLTNTSEAGRESIQAKSHVSNINMSNQRQSKHLSHVENKNSSHYANENSGPKNLSSQDFPRVGETHFSSNRNRGQRSLNKIVNCMNSPNKVEVPLTSTVSMSSWSTILSKESKKVAKSNPETEENNLRGNGNSLNTEQTDVLSPAIDDGADCPEPEPSVFGHIKYAFSLAGMPQTLSIEPVSQERSQLSSGFSHFKKLVARKGEPGRKTKTSEVGANTTKAEQSFQKPLQATNVTEVPASYVDLSWRIVTSSDGHSSSLSNFFKLVPITIARGTSGKVDSQEPMSFLGVPIHGGPAVIAKILNTSSAQNCNEIFVVTRQPNIETGGTYVKKSTLSFVWDSDTVLVTSESLKAGNLSGKDVKPRPPVWIDNCNRVSIVLPKPLRLPEAGNTIYLGDFNVKANDVEFVVTHSVVVTKSPRPSLTVPSGTPVHSSPSISQAIRCRSPKKTTNNAQATNKVPVGKKTVKGIVKTFQKCVFCGTELTCRRDVKIHRKLHTSFAGTKCSECKRRFQNGGRLSVHLDTHKCNWLHNCAVCQNPYRTPKFLTPVDLDKDYYKMCLPCRRKELKCKKCRERMLTFEDLERHLKEKHGLHCPICKCSFFFKRDLTKHMNIEHGLISTPLSVSTTSS